MRDRTNGFATKPAGASVSAPGNPMVEVDIEMFGLDEDSEPTDEDAEPEDSEPTDEDASPCTGCKGICRYCVLHEE